jgi:hypothetical protein
MRGMIFRSTCALLAACGLSAAIPTFGTEKAAPQDAAAAPKVMAPAYTKPMPLTDEKVKGFLDAVDEIKALGPEGQKFSPTNPSLVKTMQFSDKTTAIIKKHGFADAIDFQHVAYNAASAYYVVKNGGREAIKKKLAASDVKRTEAMEKLKTHLTPEQLKMLETQMGAGTAAMHALAEQPDANLELIKKYSARMEALGKK